MACEAECRAFLTIQAGFAYIYICIYTYMYIYLYIYIYESRPGSWPVVVCERSENRGSGGGSG